MSSKSPIFPMPETQHFSDYGFDPQIEFFQFMEEARKHKRETSTKSSMDSFHFKLRKPISKEDSSLRKTNSNKKKRWWKNALLFFKWKKWVHVTGFYTNKNDSVFSEDEEKDVHKARARAFRASSSISGPVYITESRSGSTTPYRTSKPFSGPLAGTFSPARNSDLDMPYLSLRELNREQQQQQQQRQRVSSSPMPVYLVT